MINFSEVYQRICEVTQIATQMQLAELLEIRQSSISDAKRRNSIPAEWYMKLFEKYNLNPDWLKTGQGPKFLERVKSGSVSYAPASVAEAPASYKILPSQSVTVPVYSMRCKYSGTLPLPKLDSNESMSISREFIHSEIIVLRNNSSALHPTLRKDAYVGVDTSSKDPVSGELYAIFMPYEGVAIRRVFFDQANGHFVLRTDQPDHIEATIAAEQLPQQVLGKICWVLQRF